MTIQNSEESYKVNYYITNVMTYVAVMCKVETRTCMNRICNIVLRYVWNCGIELNGVDWNKME